MGSGGVAGALDCGTSTVAVVVVNLEMMLVTTFVGPAAVPGAWPGTFDEKSVLPKVSMARLLIAAMVVRKRIL